MEGDSDGSGEAARRAEVQAWAAKAAGARRQPSKADRLKWSDDARIQFCIAKARIESAGQPDVEAAFGINLAEAVDKIGPDIDLLEEEVLALPDGEKLVEEFRAAFQDDQGDEEN